MFSTCAQWDKKGDRRGRRPGPYLRKGEDALSQAVPLPTLCQQARPAWHSGVREGTSQLMTWPPGRCGSLD